MTYSVYIEESSINVSNSIHKLEEGLTILKKTPQISFNQNTEMGIGLKRFLVFKFWIFLLHGFKGIFAEYQICKKTNVIAKVVAMSYIPKYKFMPRDGIHVGFARTNPEFRGKGYYTMLLKYVIEDLSNKDLYMFTKDTNIASKKGIEKAGFKYIKKCLKVGRYFIDMI